MSTVMGFVASNSDTVQLARLRRGLLTYFAQCGVYNLKYMINMQSYGFWYNLGMIALESMWLPILIHRAGNYSRSVSFRHSHKGCKLSLESNNKR